MHLNATFVYTNEAITVDGGGCHSRNSPASSCLWNLLEDVIVIYTFINIGDAIIDTFGDDCRGCPPPQ